MNDEFTIDGATLRTESMSIKELPEPAGAYLIGDNGWQLEVCAFKKRPPWLHRTLMRVLLGFRWEDAAP